VLFGWGADGWASSGVAGVDLEYFKDDVPRLLDLQTHETYHAAQAALSRGEPADAGTDVRGLWLRALDTLYSEGTATHVAPPRLLPGPERERLAARGRQILSELRAAVAAGDEQSGRKLANEGRQGAGPLYWLGASMAQSIERHGGAAAVAAYLVGGAPAFLDAYQHAAHAGHGEPLPAAWITAPER
jgi:hypothetical protein